MNLKQYSTEQLEAELKRREKIEIPSQLENVDLSGLREACAIYIQEIVKGEGDSDSQHYIYEEAMKALYGLDIFTWLRKQFE